LKNFKVEVVLFSLILGMLILIALLSQVFSSLSVLLMPLSVFLLCTYTWIEAKKKKPNIRIAGISLILMIIFSVFFKGIELFQNLTAVLFTIVIGVLLWEFTKKALNNTKYSLLWMTIIPLVALGIVLEFTNNVTSVYLSIYITFMVLL